MPATLVAKLAPASAPADPRTRVAKTSSPKDDATNFKQALADARPRAVPSDRSNATDRPAADSNGTKSKSTAASEIKSARGEQSEDPSKKPVETSAAGETVAVESADDMPDDVSAIGFADAAVSDVAIDRDAAPLVPVTADQTESSDLDAAPTDAPGPTEIAPESTVAGSSTPAALGAPAPVTPDTEIAAVAGSDIATPAKPDAVIDAVVKPADAKPAAVAGVIQPPAGDAKTVAPQLVKDSAVVQTDPLVAAEVEPKSSADTDSNSGDGQSPRNPNAAAQVRPAATASPADPTQHPAEFAANLADNIEQIDSDKNAVAASPAARSAAPAAADKPAPAPPPQQAFAQQNHERIVSSVRTQLLPNGGSMQIRLQPGNLGSMQISVRMVDGVMSASFQTSNAEATRLLSHSLSQLKTTLETQGIQVDRIQVTQAPREAQSAQDNPSNDPSRQNPSRQDQQQQAHEENQRRLILNRMWRHMSTGADPLDLVA